MPENEIIAEIHRTRAEIARECDYDVDKLFAYFRQRTAQLLAEGWKVADLPTPTHEADESCVVREEPPEP